MIGGETQKMPGDQMIQGNHTEMKQIKNHATLGHDGSRRALRCPIPAKDEQSKSNCRWILYQLSHKGSPRILEWVAYPFSKGSS